MTPRSSNLTTILDTAPGWQRYTGDSYHATYRARLAKPGVRRKWAYVTAFAEGNATTEDATGYRLAFDSVAEARDHLARQIVNRKQPPCNP